LREALDRTSRIEPADDLPGVELLNRALQHLGQTFDPQWGGFGAAPKFPSTMNLELMLRAFVHSGADAAREIVTTSLDALASGGRDDHLRGGLSRSPVDERWLVPHFEKMLYDQALLARAYLHGWQVTGARRYGRVLADTIGYVLRDLHDHSGGFYSAEDADSEGVEGKFYVWTPAELHEALGLHAEPAVPWRGGAQGRTLD